MDKFALNYNVEFITLYKKMDRLNCADGGEKDNNLSEFLIISVKEKL